MLFACSGVAQALHAVADTTRWPTWLAQGTQSFMLAALGILSVLMIASIPPLLEILRASDEVLSLRDQAKFQAVVQAAPMAVISADRQGRITAGIPRPREFSDGSRRRSSEHLRERGQRTAWGTLSSCWKERCEAKW